MDKFNKIATTINATHELSEIKEQFQSVKKSNLTDEEKNQALKFHNKMIKTTNFVCFKLVVFLFFL